MLFHLLNSVENVSDKSKPKALVRRVDRIKISFLAQTFNHIKGNLSLVLMHRGIINGYQLLCDAHTVLEPHR